MTLTALSAEVTETRARTRHVDVKAKGPRGGVQEWTVDFDRHNHPTGAFCYKPLLGYHVASGRPKHEKTDTVPPEIIAAAWSALAPLVTA